MSSSSNKALRIAHYIVSPNGLGLPDQIGGGAFGAVYRAVDIRSGDCVALKVLHEYLVSDPVVRLRFQAEIKEHRRLKHPGIVSILDFGEDGTRLFYAMEMCLGGDLAEMTKSFGGPIPLILTLEIIKQVADALVYASGHHLLHRDIKPGNILLRDKLKAEVLPVVKVTDFGLSKLSGEMEGAARSQMSLGGGFQGTLFYASPEQVRQEELDCRSDIFSLGMTMWHLLVGGYPLSSKKDHEMISGRVNGESYRGLLPSNLPPAVEKMLGRMLEKNPKDRYRDFGELTRVIDLCLEDSARNGGSRGLSSPDRIPQPGFQSGSPLDMREVQMTPMDDTPIGPRYLAKGGDFGLPGWETCEVIYLSGRNHPEIEGQVAEAVRKASEDHPNIVPLRWLESQEGPLVAMGHCGNFPDLMGFVRRRSKAPLASVLPMLRQTASALDHASARELRLEAHPKDVKIMADPEGQKLLFLVKLPGMHAKSANNEHLTVAGTLVTESFVASGSAARDFATLLYWLVAARIPPAAAHVNEAAYKSIEGLGDEGNGLLARILCGNRKGPVGPLLDEICRIENVEAVVPTSSSPSDFETDWDRNADTGAKPEEKKQAQAHPKTETRPPEVGPTALGKGLPRRSVLAAALLVGAVLLALLAWNLDRPAKIDGETTGAASLPKTQASTETLSQDATVEIPDSSPVPGFSELMEKVIDAEKNPGNYEETELKELMDTLDKEKSPEYRDRVGKVIEALRKGKQDAITSKGKEVEAAIRQGDFARAGTLTSELEALERESGAEMEKKSSAYQTQIDNGLAILGVRNLIQSGSTEDLDRAKRQLDDLSPDLPGFSETRIELQRAEKKAEVAARQPGDQKIITLPDNVKMVFRWCPRPPEGEFTMGLPEDKLNEMLKSTPEILSVAAGNEKHQRAKIGSGFWMAETEVTQGQWQAVMNSSLLAQVDLAIKDETRHTVGATTQTNRYFLKPIEGEKIDGKGNNYNPVSYIGETAADYPMYYVSWEDAKLFCRKALPIEGGAFRLPTEIEWEYACRAGDSDKISAGDFKILAPYSAPDLNEVAWHGGNSHVDYQGKGWKCDWLLGDDGNKLAGPRIVGLKIPNPWGLKDMLGNLSEWCLDPPFIYDGSGYLTNNPGSAREENGFRAIRGGDWLRMVPFSRPTFRDNQAEGFRSRVVGFRVVLEDL